MLSAATLERVSEDYRNGYYHGWRGLQKIVPETGLEQLGDDPIGGVLAPFASVDYENGYKAGANDAYWGAVHAKEPLPRAPLGCR